jgi:putative spermidine/putrescine transport system permease protein
MSQLVVPQTQNTSTAGQAIRGFSWAWLGVVPFFIFAFLFMLWPALSIFTSSFQDRQGNFTFDNILGLTQPFI